MAPQDRSTILTPMVGISPLAARLLNTIVKTGSVFSDDYDGGEFCKGLIFSHEAGQLVLTVGK